MSTTIQITRHDFSKIEEMLSLGGLSIMELECVLDKKITIDVFRNIMSRLRGLEDIFVSEDKSDTLDISFIDEDDKKDHRGRSSISYIRRTIMGIDHIINYCNNDVFENYSDYYKDRASEVLKISNYDIKFNLKYEINLHDKDKVESMSIPEDVKVKVSTSIDTFDNVEANIHNLDKTFRKKERYSFYTICTCFRVDLTIVKSSKRPHKKLIGSGIFDTTETYEVEVEFINEHIINAYYQEADGTITFMEFLKSKYPRITMNFLSYIGYILQVVNNSDYLITNSEKNIIRTNYINGIRSFKTTNKFISPNPVSLSMKNIDPQNPNNIFNGYSVTDKADGESRLLFVPYFDSSLPAYQKYNRRVYLLNNILDVVYTGIDIDSDIGLTVLNGEFIQKDCRGDKMSLMMCYDAYIVNNKPITELPLFNNSRGQQINTRLDILKQTINLYFNVHNSELNVSYKAFYFNEDLHERNKILWNTAKENGKLHNIDVAMLNGYKLDGLIFTPNTPVSDFMGKQWNQNLKWKPAEENTIDFLVKIVDDYKQQYKILHLYCGSNVNGNYIKMKFNGSGKDNDKLAYICFLEKDNFNNIISSDRLPIYDDTIVEFRYNVNSTKDSNYNWIPLRTRYDKTRKYRENFNVFGNDIRTARNIWDSIHNPITIDRLTKDAYYKHESTKAQTMPILRKFHNFVKKVVLKRVSDLSDSSNQMVLDIGVGRGGDIHKYHENPKIATLVGIDASGECVRTAIKRYRTKDRSKLDAIFVKADARKVFKRDIVPGSILNSRMFDIIAMQFCIHYFFDREQSLDNLIENIDLNLKDKGFFIGTCMNSESVLSMLGSNNYKEGTQGNNVLWRITKKDNQVNPFGTKINVYVESIGNPQDEWLVNFNVLTEKLRAKNIYLIEDGLSKFNEKLFRSLTLNNGSFENVYMSEAEKQFSELNQYFIFQKNGKEMKNITSNITYGEPEFLSQDEKTLLTLHCTKNITGLNEFIKERKSKKEFMVMKKKKDSTGKEIYEIVNDIEFLLNKKNECGKTCGLKKHAINLLAEKMGISTTYFDKVKKAIRTKSKEILDNEIKEKLKLK